MWRTDAASKSDLRTRLARLGVGTASVAAPSRSAPDAALPPPAANVPLAERLARLRTRAAQLNAARATDEQVARDAGGAVAAPNLIRVERRFPFPHVHGGIAIGGVEGLLAGARLSLPIDAHAPQRLLMLDTETSGLAGGAGTVAFMLGLARIDADALTVVQYLMTGFGGERPMLRALLDALEDADCIVTFNGKSFDVPLLKGRTTLAGLHWPAREPLHLDLLHVARRRLREGWDDCRLRTAEAHALGFERIDDLPGAEVPAAWQRWLRDGDGSTLPRILDHNREDLLSLAGLLAVLAHPTRREAPLLHQHGRPALETVIAPS